MAGIEGVEKPRQYSIPEPRFPSNGMGTGRPELVPEELAQTLDNREAAFRPQIQHGEEAPGADSTSTMPVQQGAQEATHPGCGGRMLRWPCGTICTSCHRRFEAAGAEASASQ